METKFTKGKWGFNKETAKVYKEDENILCICFHTNITNKQESEANALLISKAPEMFEMLEGILQRREVCFEDLIEIEQLLKEATEL